MNKKGLLSIASCFCVFFTGCHSIPETDETPTAIVDCLKDADLSTHYDISIGYWNIQNLINSETKDPLLTYIEDLFNITITPVNLNWSDYNDRYLIMGVSDTLPDVFAATTISGTSENQILQLSDLIKRKIIRPIPNDLSAYPLVEQTIKNNESSLIQDDGNIYTFPRTTFQDSTLSSSDAGILVRKDWMEKLGFENPTSFFEFKDMVTAFAKEDPDGNGVDDTIGFNGGSRVVLGKWLNLGIAPQCNIFTWLDYNGAFVPSYLHPDFEKIIVAFRSLYESGGLDPEFHLKKPSDAVYDFARGNLGALEYKTSPATLAEVKLYWEMYHDASEKFEDYVTYLNIFPASDGICYSNSSSSFWSESLFSATVSDEKMERILYLYEYLLSEDGWRLTRLGLEGQDYTYTDGNYISLLNVDADSLLSVLLKKYPSLYLFTSLASWGGSDADFEENEVNNLRYGSELMQMARASLDWNRENTTAVSRPYAFIQMPRDELAQFSASAAADELAKVIIGTEDPIQMWQDVLTRWYEAGLQEYIDDANEVAKEDNIYPQSINTVDDKN